MIFLMFVINVATAATGPSPYFTDLENFRNQSLQLQSEKQNLEASNDQLTSKNLFWTPRLAISANQLKSQLNQTVIDERNFLSADLSWNLFRGGGDLNLRQAAKAQNKAQALQVENESLRVEVKASDLIFKNIYLLETKRIQDEFLKLKEESLKIVSDRFHQGKIPLQEVTKAEVDVSQQKGKARLAQLDVLENRSQIASTFVADIQTKIWPFVEKTEATLGTSEKFPIVEYQYWLAQSQEKSWASAKSDHLPTLDLTLQYQESPLKERTDKQWSGLLKLSLPIWSQYETAAKVSSEFARYTVAQNEFRATEKSISQKSLYLKEKIQIARINLSEAQRNFEKSKALYQNILKGFRTGRISTNDLTLDQNRLLDTANNLALSQLSFHQTLIESCAIAGKKAAECLKLE